jgi:hypothetical protein
VDAERLPVPLAEVFAAAVALHVPVAGGDRDRDRVFAVLDPVRQYGHEAVAYATGAASSPTIAARAAAADFLGEVCNGQPQFVDAALPVLERLLANETETEVLWSIAHALGNLWDRRTLEPLLSLADDEDETVRLAVAQGLHGAMAEGANARGIEALIRLSTDPDSRVRNWATFGLARLDADSPEIRYALRARLDDLDPEAREEAVCGLARRRDRGALSVVAELLAVGTAGPLLFEAAAYLAEPTLLPLLRTYSDEVPGVRRALLECDPARRERRDSACAELLRRVQELLDLRRPGSVASLSCERFGVEVTLAVTCGGEELYWGAEPVLEAVGGDPSSGADRVLAQLVTR